jgi:hypothetical protein
MYSCTVHAMGSPEDMARIGIGAWVDFVSIAVESSDLPKACQSLMNRRTGSSAEIDPVLQVSKQSGQRLHTECRFCCLS